MAEDSLGELLVAFKADLSGLNSGADAAKKKLGEVDNSAKQTGGGFLSMLKNAATFATGQALFTGVGDAIGFLKDQTVDAVHLAMQHQLVMAQTVQVLRSTKDASGQTADSIDNLATSLSQITPFSADAIQGSENLELTFTNIGKNVFPQAEQSILDVSQAMHEDLSSASIQVGKALNDPLTGMTALQRIGVTFTAQEKLQIQTMMAHNNVIGAQKIILHELSTEFGGSATAAGKTLAGQMDILKNKFDDVKIKIGTALLPILNDLLSATLPVVDEFSTFAVALTDDVTPAIKNIGSWLQVSTIPLFNFSRAVISNTTSYFKYLADIMSGPTHSAFDATRSIVQNEVIPQFTNLNAVVDSQVSKAFIQLTPVTLSLADTLKGDLASGTTFASQELQALGGWMQNTGEPTFTDFASVVKDKVGKALSATGTWIQTTGIPDYTKFAGVVKNKLGAAYLALGQDVEQGTKNLGAKLGGIAGGSPKVDLKSLFGNADLGSIAISLHTISVDLDGISQAFSGVEQTVQGAWSFLKPIFDAWGEWSGRIQTDWGKDLPSLEQSLGKFAATMSAVITQVEYNLEHIPFIGDLFKKIFDVKGVGVDWQHLGDVLIDGFFNWLPGAVKKSVDTLSSFFNTMETLNGVFANVDAEFVSVGSAISTGWNDMWAGIIQTADAWGVDLVLGVQHVWAGVEAEFRSGINTIISELNSFISGLDQMSINFGPIHIGAPNIPQIPYLASGGDTSPGWFVAGDQGPELVYSSGGAHVYNAGQTQTMLSGGGGDTHIHVHIGSDEIADYVMDAVTNTLRRVGRNRR